MSGTDHWIVRATPRRRRRAGNAELARLRLEMSRARKLAPDILAFYLPRSGAPYKKSHPAMIETLATHMVAEAFDVRPYQLRRALNVRRKDVHQRRTVWWDRRDQDGALDELIQCAIDELRGGE